MARPKIIINNWFVASFGRGFDLIYRQPAIDKPGDRLICGEITDGRVFASTDGTPSCSARLIGVNKRRLAVLDCGRLDVWFLGTISKTYRRWLKKRYPAWNYKRPIDCSLPILSILVEPYLNEWENKYDTVTIPAGGVHVGNDPRYW